MKVTVSYLPFYLEQVEQLPPAHPPQPEEAVTLPCASFELNAKFETSRFKSLPLHFGQRMSSWLIRTK
jgi:hypothetical protein